MIQHTVETQNRQIWITRILQEYDNLSHSEKNGEISRQSQVQNS